MDPERIVRGFAGFVILLSLVLAAVSGQAHLAGPSWLWLTAFVGLNLLQSAFTNWCPLLTLLRRARHPAHAH